MSDRQLNVVLRHIRIVAGTPDKDWTDRELLAAFVTRKDQAAFTALVNRHGPLVLGICRRVLHHFQDAEDAFQATFLLLARRGAGIRKPESLASWLHAVAYRMAHNAKRSAARRRKYEGAARPAPSANPASELVWREVQALLDDEIRRLPEIYRAPFLLCYLENRRQADVARQLGLKEGTVWGRLARARRLLQERLARHGVVLPAALGLLAVSAEAATAAISGSLAAATVQAAAGGAAGGVSAEILALVQKMNRAMMLAKYKIATALLAALGVLGAGASLALRPPPDVQAYHRRQLPPPALEQQPPPVAQPVRAAGNATRRIRGQLLDQDGNPVPEALLALVPLAPGSHGQGRVPVIPVKGGRFEAGECEAGARYAVLAVDAAWRRGGVGELTAKEGDVGAVQVPLHDTCCIRARCVESEGKPVAPRYPLQVWIKGLSKGGVSAGRLVSLPDPFVGATRADGKGRVALDGLIPGVTYALSAAGREVHEFVAEPGRKLEFGDLVAPSR